MMERYISEVQITIFPTQTEDKIFLTDERTTLLKYAMQTVGSMSILN
jgi:hypothetical protein